MLLSNLEEDEGPTLHFPFLIEAIEFEIPTALGHSRGIHRRADQGQPVQLPPKENVC